MNNTTAMRFLVVIETQKVKSYLFASPIMRETRGASVLLDLMNRKKTEEILKGAGSSGTAYEKYEKVYLGGGSGRVLFENKEDAESFKKEVLDLYRRETIDARVAVEIVQRGEEGKDETFAEWVRRGVRKCQEDKLGRIEGVPILAGRWVRPCTSCGCQPAEKMLTEHGSHRLCRSCLRKREEAKHLYREVKRPNQGVNLGVKQPTGNGYRILRSFPELKSQYTDRFIFTTLAQYNEKEGKKDYQVLLPQDFEDIGKASKPSNYIGFIYADGNRMGEVVKNIGKRFPGDKEAKIAYKAFSEIVDQATREAAVDAVMEEVSEIDDREKYYRIPAEFIMAGGDDLMLALPAHNALDVAILFLEKFQEKTKELQDKYISQGELPQRFSADGLTTSAGVVIAHSHYPVSDLMSYAGELMKLAKRKAAQLARPITTQQSKEHGQEVGTLDFMVLTESGSEPVKDRRKTEYKNFSLTGKPIRLTERPYTTAEAGQLLKTIRDLKDSDVPRSKLKALYPVLFQSSIQAQFDALRIKDRLKVTGDLKVESVLRKLIAGLASFPFRGTQNDPEWTTPMTEIIELYDFIQPRRGLNKETEEEIGQDEAPLEREAAHD